MLLETPGDAGLIMGALAVHCLTPLHVLQGLPRKVGLLRLSKDVNRPTRIAGDDLEVVRRLRSWFV